MATPTNTRFAVAVHVLTYLAGDDVAGRPVSSDELAGSTGTNPVHVRRMLGPLRRAGLVRSRPGAHGGSELARPAADITLGEVWALLQGDDPVLGLHGPDPGCVIGTRVQRGLAHLDRAVAGAVIGELARVTVADMVAGVADVPPVPHRG